jgi:hypothetical protein
VGDTSAALVLLAHSATFLEHSDRACHHVLAPATTFGMALWLTHFYLYSDDIFLTISGREETAAVTSSWQHSPRTSADNKLHLLSIHMKQPVQNANHTTCKPTPTNTATSNGKTWLYRVPSTKLRRVRPTNAASQSQNLVRL